MRWYLLCINSELLFWLSLLEMSVCFPSNTPFAQ